MVLISLPVTDSLFFAGERLAIRLGLSRSRLYQLALQEFLSRHGDIGVTESLDRLYRDETSKAHVDPQLARIQNDSLSRGK